ncbi:putative F-box protein At1g60370 [Solanum verrucosum]|uniref:putative F-box protein At1g60370 n=1 Tax=Solanum verrucosum TaxID=315347 RepID=UPI0020D039FC|nr:putative F-box protein At1g60370 [Solanum verrucosum]
MEKLGHEDITSEIISWLPAKSIMRFKCICKAWNTWIEQPNFPKLHQARSQARPSGTRLLFELYPCEPRPHRHPLDYKIGFRSKKQRRLERYSLEFTTRFYIEDMFICSNHCNGLVCLYRSKDTQVYLFNVSTREIKALPFSVEGVKKNTMDPRLYLGFDKVAEKYKLLHIIWEREPRRMMKHTILTLGTNSWRSITIPRDCFMTYARHIYLDGFLYGVDTFTYFNFTEEKFDNLPHKQLCKCRLSLNVMQTALRGKLVVHCGRGRANANLICNDLKKDFTKFVDYSDISEKVITLETYRIDRPTEPLDAVLATASIIGAPTSLLHPDLFIIAHVSSFVDNIIPLTSLF